MTSRVRSSVTIDAPIEDVFAFFDELKFARLLVPQLVEITGVEDLPNGGRRVSYTTLGRDHQVFDASSEHLVYDPPEQTVGRSVQSGVEMLSTRRFTAIADDRTRVDAVVEWSVPVRFVAKMVERPLRRPLRAALRNGLATAKSYLERA